MVRRRMLRNHFKTLYYELNLRWLFSCGGRIAKVNSARRRVNGAIWSVADRCPVGKDPAPAPLATATTAWRSASGSGSQSAGRHFVDSA